MKRVLQSTILLTGVMLAGSLESTAQNQVYFRDGFETHTFQTSAANSLTGHYATSEGGTYYAQGAYVTTGNACTAPYGARHIRFTGSLALPDSPSLVTPIVENGINEFHFTRTRANRRYSIFKTNDTLATTTNWTLAAFVPISPNICSDTTILIADPTAKRLKIVTRQGTDSDIDSIFITSVTALPVTFAGFNAVEANGKVNVTWKIATELNTARYAVERSGDGRNFIEVGSVVATNSSSYAWTDHNPTLNNYYRIKWIDKDGHVGFTNVVKLSLSKKGGNIAIAPNPVKGNVVNLQIEALAKGSYAVSVFNNIGQQVFTRTINHQGGSSTVGLQLPASVKSGVYNLQVTDGQNIINKKLVIE